MSRKLILAAAILAFAWVATGCSALQKLKQPNTEFTRAPFEVPSKAVSPLAKKDVPRDVSLATAAIIKKMRHEPGGVPGVSFSSPGSYQIPDRDFDWQGLSVTKITIVDHWARKSGKGWHSSKLRGVLQFSDTLGRRALVDYLVDYRFSRRKVVIDRARVMPVAPLFPNTQAFFIQADKLKEIVAAQPDFVSFYTRIVSDAYSMNPTPEEVKEHQALKKKGFFDRLTYSSGKERKDIFVLVFVMDRLTPDAALDVVVSKDLYEKNTLVKAAYMDFSGWRVAVFGGNFALDRDKFYAKVYYKPANGVLPQGKDKVLIGLFDSQKNYRDKGGSAAEGPLAAGSRLLDVSDKNDAALIQSRLAELGFYRMKIDGMWGAGSRAALKDFQMRGGLQPTGKWGRGTQMKLFAGTGR
jgi:hypothetical protein